MPTNDPRPTKNQRRDDARAKALELRKEQERKARRNRLIAIGGLAVAVIALGAVVFTILRNAAEAEAQYGNVAYGGGGDDVVAPALDAVTLPATANDLGGIPVSDEGVGTEGDGDTVVTIYFDFMCPYCGMFDAANSEDLEALAAEDGVTVDYRPISFLDAQSNGTFYSTRTANAAGIVADQAPEQFTAFVTALYENQPEEGSEGLTDEEIADIATGVGVPDAVTATFTDTVDGTFQAGESQEEKSGTWRTFAPWAAAATNQMQIDLGRIGTPTVLIDGEEWPGEGGDAGQLYQTGPLKAAVEAARDAS